MSKSNGRSRQSSDRAEPPRGEEQQAAENTGRDAQGRFTTGNGGGPGNPFARRVAQLRSILLETVTDEEMRIVAGQLMVKAKFGNLEAIKLLFQYVLGKPAATVNPDALDVEEMDLYRRAPEHAKVQEVLAERVPADLAVDMLRLALPFVAEKMANGARDAILDPDGFRRECDRINGLDDDDFDDEDEKDAAEERQSVGAAPSPNGGTHADPRPRATRPSPNGRSASAKLQAGPADFHDDRRRSSGERGSERQPPYGA